MNNITLLCFVPIQIHYIFAPKMEPPIRNKPPIWNTFAADRVVFRIGGFTVYKFYHATFHACI